MDLGPLKSIIPLLVIGCISDGAPALGKFWAEFSATCTIPTLYPRNPSLLFLTVISFKGPLNVNTSGVSFTNCSSFSPSSVILPLFSKIIPFSWDTNPKVSGPAKWTVLDWGI